MAFNEFTAGVNTSFSSQLNENFNLISRQLLKGRINAAAAFEEKFFEKDASLSNTYLNIPNSVR